jgi:hypothetical protein
MINAILSPNRSVPTTFQKKKKKKKKNKAEEFNLRWLDTFKHDGKKK